MTQSTISGVITLNSNLGQQKWQQATLKNQQMLDHYTPCNSPILSGVVSLTLLLNALNFVNRIKVTNAQNPSEADQLLKKINNGEKLVITVQEVLRLSKIQEYLQEIKIYEKGMSLEEIDKIASLDLGFGTMLAFAKTNISLNNEQTKKLADRSEIESVDALKEFIQRRLSVSIGGVFANYDPSLLGLSKKPDSSFGIVAGYHEGFILVMDVGEVGPVWVEAKLLLKAMAQIDPKSNLPMGYIFIHELL